MNNTWLEYIYEHLHREAFLWARQCCAYDEEQAREVMQTVYLKVLEGKAKYHQRAEIKTWLFAVIRFTSIDCLKGRSNHVGLENITDVEKEVEFDAETDYQQILKKLPERQHQVLLLVFYHNMKLKEVAEVLDISIGSVRTHYDRGKKKLKVLITKERIYDI